jgi:hypothetical protein
MLEPTKLRAPALKLVYAFTVDGHVMITMAAVEGAQAALQVCVMCINSTV